MLMDSALVMQKLCRQLNGVCIFLTRRNFFHLFTARFSADHIHQSKPLTMPNVSDRQKLLTEVEQAMKLSAIDTFMRDSDPDSSEVSEGSVTSEEDDGNFENLCSLHYLITEQRFLNPRRTLAKSRDYILNYFLDQPDDCFRKITRVSRATFNHIIELIRFDPVFHNVSNCEQAPIHWQLACALDRLGNDGQGVSHARSKIIWGIGQGTVHLYTRRVVAALWALRNQYICWPNVEERSRISRRMERKGFKHAVGFVDGTTIPLHKKPAEHGNIYMDRKKRYSINAQVICDDQYHIIFFMTGQPGSSHDSRVFSRSRVVQRPDLCFSPREYLLADSAYAAMTNIIPPYKENQRDDRTDLDEPRKLELFNTFLAKARVVNEHTIGIWKGRWSSLRGMRVDIHEHSDISTFVKQATACVVLHNLCIGSDPWYEEFQEEDAGAEDEDDAVNEVRPRRIMTPGQRRRLEIRRACLAYHGME